MGVDYSRFRLKEGTERAALLPVIERQCVAYQSIWGWDSQAISDFNDVPRALTERLHLESYLSSSQQLRDASDFAPWDDEKCCTTDIVDLAPCLRVYAIADNPIFPPWWRVRACRTILPDQLPAQVVEWRTWIEEVLSGVHDDYMVKLQTHANSDFFRYHWSVLRNAAIASQAGSDSNREIGKLRQRVLLLPEPPVFSAPIEEDASEVAYVKSARELFFKSVKEVIELEQSWNEHAEDDWKTPGYSYETYDLSLTDFKRHAHSDWLHALLDWANRCVENECGLFLDY